MRDEILYTPEEIAQKLKLSKYTIYEMIKRDAKLGLASLCIGGGQGCAVIVKRP